MPAPGAAGCGRGSAAGTVVGGFETTDDDLDDTFTYMLVAGSGDVDNAAFEVVGGGVAEGVGVVGDGLEVVGLATGGDELIGGALGVEVGGGFADGDALPAAFGGFPVFAFSCCFTGNPAVFVDGSTCAA